jgi:hypothetical protein
MFANQPARVVFEFENDRITTVTATFESKGAYDALLADNLKFGTPQAEPAPATRSSATRSAAAAASDAGGRRAHWVKEHDVAALDIDLAERPGGATTLVYRILGQRVDVRLAGRRSENLQARVITRHPAAQSEVASASLTHLGGGEAQNDPHDQTGKKVQTPVFEVRLQLDNAALEHLPGQRAYARFTMEKDRPLIWQWSRKFWQLIQSEKNPWL